MKCNQSRPGFELVSPCPFPTSITITQRAPPNLYDFRFKWTVTAGIVTSCDNHVKHDCHSCWISKMQSDTLEEWYAIKFCFKLGKNATETYGMLQTAFRPSCIEHQFLSGIRDSRKSLRNDERCGRRKEVNTPKLIGQRVRVRVRVTMLRF